MMNKNKKILEIHNKYHLNEHFFIKDNIAQCQHCKKEFTSLRSFNLRAHLAILHGIEIEPRNFKIKTKPEKVKINRNQFIKSYVGLVIDEGVSFDALNTEHMRNIIEPVCRSIEKKNHKQFILNADKCKRIIATVAANALKSHKAELQNKLLSLTIDVAIADGLWCNNKILGVSAQFIENGTILSRFLGLIALKKKNEQTVTEDLSSEILKLLNIFDIKLTQIVSITTGVSDIFRSLKSSHSCYDDDCSFFENVQFFENDIDELFVGDIQVNKWACHETQLCILDVFKKPIIKSYILKCRKLVKFLTKNSNAYRQHYEEHGLKIPELNCPSKRTSTYCMLKDLVNFKDFFDWIKNNEEMENLELSKDLWDFIGAYCLVFKPFYKALLRYQNGPLHYSDFYAQWLKCSLLTKRLFNDHFHNEHSILTKIVTALTQIIDERTEKLFTNSAFVACLYMDPRFHHLLNKQHRTQAISYLKTLWEQFKKCTHYLTTIKTETMDSNDNNKSEEDADNDPLSLLKPLCESTTQPIDDPDEEILNDYIQKKSVELQKITVNMKIENLTFSLQVKSTIDVLEFWKDRSCIDPELYILSQICFAIPSSEFFSERVAFAIKFILEGHTSNLPSIEVLENIIMAKLNPNFLEELILQENILFTEVEEDIMS